MNRQSTLLIWVCVFLALALGLWISQPSPAQVVVPAGQPKPKDGIVTLGELVQAKPPQPQQPKVGRYQIATAVSPGGLNYVYMCDTETGQLWSYASNQGKWTPMQSPVATGNPPVDPKAIIIVPKK